MEQSSLSTKYCPYTNNHLVIVVLYSLFVTTPLPSQWPDITWGKPCVPIRAHLVSTNVILCPLQPLSNLVVFILRSSSLFSLFPFIVGRS
jgi:hypothetical protein